jgi:hypothetical protein
LIIFVFESPPFSDKALFETGNLGGFLFTSFGSNPTKQCSQEIGALADAYIPASFSEPSDLLQFLQELGDGKPPVAIGFGSMPQLGSFRSDGWRCSEVIFGMIYPLVI